MEDFVLIDWLSEWMNEWRLAKFLFQKLAETYMMTSEYNILQRMNVPAAVCRKNGTQLDDAVDGIDVWGLKKYDASQRFLILLSTDQN